MTVKDLIKELKGMPQNMEVMSEYDYGDRCHTRALKKVRGVDVASVKESAYSDSGLAVDEDGDGEGQEVVVI